MNTTGGHFDLNSPESLFEKATSDYLEFFKNPNSWVLFNVLTTFNHLLEWICPKAYRKSSLVHGTPQQIFYSKMWNQQDFQTIRKLCNKSKHFSHEFNSPTTSVIKKARTGLMRAGDSLSQKYFIVDGTDIRDILINVYKSYKQYFDS